MATHSIDATVAVHQGCPLRNEGCTARCDLPDVHFTRECRYYIMVRAVSSVGTLTAVVVQRSRFHTLHGVLTEQRTAVLDVHRRGAAQPAAPAFVRLAAPAAAQPGACADSAARAAGQQVHPPVARLLAAGTVTCALTLPTLLLALIYSV